MFEQLLDLAVLLALAVGPFADHLLLGAHVRDQRLDRFGKESPQTRIEWFETVLDGTPEALSTGKADLAITGTLPQGLPGELLLTARFIPVAHPNHELHQLGRPLEYRDLR